MRARFLATSGLLTLGLAPLGLFAACGDDTDPVPTLPLTTELELVGEWSSIYGDETITATTWGSAAVRAHDNGDNWAIVQNPADDAFNPSKFARYVWTERSNGRFWYCVEDYGLASLEAAEGSTKKADRTSPATGGCGGFPWTELFVPLEVRGTYTSNFGGMETITSTAWAGTPLRAFDNTTNVAITQNAADSPFNPGAFNKIVWTEPRAGSFYYCFVDFGVATLELAQSSTKTADATSPDTTGCGMFSWTKLSK